MRVCFFLARSVVELSEDKWRRDLWMPPPPTRFPPAVRDVYQSLPHCRQLCLTFAGCIVIALLFLWPGQTAASPPPPLPSPLRRSRAGARARGARVTCPSLSASAHESAGPATAVSAASSLSLPAALASLSALVADSGARASFGSVDAATLAPRLALYYTYSWQRSEASGALYDVGANLGDVCNALFEGIVRGAVSCHRFQRSGINLTGHREACPFFVWPVYAFEPNPASLAVLRARAVSERWDIAQFVPVHAALTDIAPPQPGAMARFYSAGGQGDQQGALGAAAGETQAYFEVPLTTLDGFRAAHSLEEEPIFLLKVDAEGFDGKVLAGAERALSARKVKFVVAEYNSKWRLVLDEAARAPAWSLRTVAAWMRSRGYECHLLTPTHLIPLFDGFWQDAYETWSFSNILCAQFCDPDVLHLAAGYRPGIWAVPRPDCPPPPPPVLDLLSLL